MKKYYFYDLYLNRKCCASLLKNPDILKYFFLYYSCHFPNYLHIIIKAVRFMHFYIYYGGHACVYSDSTLVGPRFGMVVMFVYILPWLVLGLVWWSCLCISYPGQLTKDRESTNICVKCFTTHRVCKET